MKSISTNIAQQHREQHIEQYGAYHNMLVSKHVAPYVVHTLSTCCSIFCPRCFNLPSICCWECWCKCIPLLIHVLPYDAAYAVHMLLDYSAHMLLRMLSIRFWVVLLHMLSICCFICCPHVAPYALHMSMHMRL